MTLPGPFLSPLFSSCEDIRSLLLKCHRTNRTTMPRLLGTLGDYRWRGMLSQCYLVGLPTTRGLWAKTAEVIPEAETDEEQELLSYLALISTVHHPLALQLPRDLSHTLSALLWLQGRFVNRGWKHDFFNAKIKQCREQLNLEKQPALAYKTYIVNEKDFQLFNQVILVNVLQGLDFLNSEADEVYSNSLPKEIKHFMTLTNIPKKYKRRSSSMNFDSQTNGLTTFQSQERSFNQFWGSVSPHLDSSHVTLLEAVEGITRGTTGLTSWGGGAILAQWLQRNTNIIKGKDLLELGSGVGYMVSFLLKSFVPIQNLGTSQPNPDCGITAPNGGSPAARSLGFTSFTATDCHPHVLDLLDHNLAIMEAKQDWSAGCLRSHRSNLSQRMEKEGLDAAWVDPANPWKSPTKSNVIRNVDTKVLYLDWRKPNLAELPEVDVILASDIVFAKHLLQPLAALLRALIVRRCNGRADEGGSSPPHSDRVRYLATEAYIACTRRNDETLNEFLSLLVLNKLSYRVAFETELEPQNALFFYNESRVPIQIFRITAAATA